MHYGYAQLSIIKHEGIDIYIVNIHDRSGKDYDKFYKIMMEILDILKYKENVLICGDFNLNRPQYTDNKYGKTFLYDLFKLFNDNYFTKCNTTYCDISNDYFRPNKRKHIEILHRLKDYNIFTEKLKKPYNIIVIPINIGLYL